MFLCFGCSELKGFFPDNAVEVLHIYLCCVAHFRRDMTIFLQYFVSYYDYFRPESYLSVKDVHLEKVSRVRSRGTALDREQPLLFPMSAGYRRYRW